MIELIINHPAPTTGITHVRLAYFPDEGWFWLQEGRMWHNLFMGKRGETLELYDHPELVALLKDGQEWDHAEILDLLIPDGVDLSYDSTFPTEEEMWDAETEETEEFDSALIAARLAALETAEVKTS